MEGKVSRSLCTREVESHVSGAQSVEAVGSSGVANSEGVGKSTKRILEGEPQRWMVCDASTMAMASPDGAISNMER